MAGLSFGEIVVLLVVAIVVVGPRQLPTLLRTLGEFIGRTRRLASNLRAESGIDEILRDEGIQSEIDNFRRLAAGGVSLEDDPYLKLNEKKNEGAHSEAPTTTETADGQANVAPAAGDVSTKPTPSDSSASQTAARAAASAAAPAPGHAAAPPAVTSEDTSAAAVPSAGSTIQPPLPAQEAALPSAHDSPLPAVAESHTVTLDPQPSRDGS